MHTRSLAVLLAAAALAFQVQAQSRENPLDSGGPAVGSPTSAVLTLGSVSGYTNRAAWLAAADGPSTLVDFNSLADGTLVTGTGALLPWGIADTFGSSVYGGVLSQHVYCSCTMNFPMFVAGTLPSEPNYFANDRLPPAYSTGRFTFIFENPTRACGAYVADQSPLGNFIIEVFDAGGASLGMINVPPRTLPNSFVGIVSPIAFARAEFRSAHQDDSWGIDDLEHVSGGLGTVFCPGTSCPCGNTGGPEAGCANSTGLGAKLTASGSASVAADDLVFTGSQMIPGAPTLLFVGNNAVNGGAGLPFGDGRRCAGGNIIRLGVRISDAQGVASWGPGLRPQGGWNSGDTRRLQTWYRDSSGTPCGSGFNLSHGLELTFVP